MRACACTCACVCGYLPQKLFYECMNHIGSWFTDRVVCACVYAIKVDIVEHMTHTLLAALTSSSMMGLPLLSACQFLNQVSSLG